MIISFVDWCMTFKGTSPASREKVSAVYGSKGLSKLEQMIDGMVILEARNGMLSLPDWFLSGKKNPNED